eukprot:CAMPEP_0119557550 /NCGR_PEP_ID=MMETSP1352-20130426/9190_1 /TAXON_ID=265584 /ORGANISM="Stauroneis constricta, Strain CCMP1120" /LENGTH=2298 /DNA_ID=CAMNT_0007604673 /DNA_START=349 /DNA_END=7245 /DNA_ORIENTATION=+
MATPPRWNQPPVDDGYGDDCGRFGSTARPHQQRPYRDDPGFAAVTPVFAAAATAHDSVMSGTNRSASTSASSSSHFAASMNQLGNDIDDDENARRGSEFHRSRRLKLWLILPLLVVALIVMTTLLVVEKQKNDGSSSSSSAKTTVITTIPGDSSGAIEDDQATSQSLDEDGGGAGVETPTPDLGFDSRDDGLPKEGGEVADEDTDNGETNSSNNGDESGAGSGSGNDAAATEENDDESTTNDFPISIPLPVYTCPEAEADDAKTIHSYSVHLTKTDQLCVLVRVSGGTEGSEPAMQPIARAYHDNDWEVAGTTEVMKATSSAAQIVNCNFYRCQVELAPLEEGESYQLKTLEDPQYSDADIVARFLEQTTFGIKKSDIDMLLAKHYESGSSSINTVFAEWISDQQDTSQTPIQSHRALYRKYMNAQYEIPSIVGRVTQPCEIGTRYRTTVFTRKDIEGSIELSTVDMPDGSQHRAVSKIQDGTSYLYTIVDILDEYWTEDGIYTVCWITIEGAIYINHPDGNCYEMEFIDPNIPLWNEDAYMKNPYITEPAKQLLLQEQSSGPTILTFGKSTVVPVDEQYFEDDPFPFQSFLVTEDIQQAECDTEFDSFVPVFALYGDSLLIHDPRFKLFDNTLEQPLPDGGGQVFSDHANLLKPYSTAHCANVPRTFLNEDTCHVSTSPSACAYLTGWTDRNPESETATFVVTEDLIRNLYLKTRGDGAEPNAGTKYWYAVEGLDQSREGTDAMKPCDLYSQSRWIPTPCDATSLQDVDDGVVQIFSRLLSETKDWLISQDEVNPYLMDVWFWDSEVSCPASQRDVIDFMIQDQEGECWLNVHPEHLNVHDFTSWASDDGHPGNSPQRNPITEFAEAGSTRLTFPSWHEMSRWHNNKYNLPGPIRLGDEVNFYDLPDNLRTEALAEIFGIELLEPGDPELEDGYGSLSGEGTVVCGSPFEVANEPENAGSAFQGSFDSYTQEFATSWELFANQRKFVWLKNTVENDIDQLRQRMAWALSQILVISPDGVDGELDTEAFLTYYDIFVRHAFGSYRDILKEVSYHPLMADMLTYYGGRSTAFVYAQDGTVEYADENYAREIMQLFSIGLFKLHTNGTQVLDEDGNPERTYSNDDIEEYARAWTGFEAQQNRGNVEIAWGNRLDPMKINYQWRDRFPKMGLNRKYVGDGYPLCADLPEKHFLREGAVYRFLGSNPLPELHHEIDQWRSDPAAKRFTLDATQSNLYEKLCNPQGDGSCAFQAKVVLDVDLDCVGDECYLDTLRTVEVSNGMYYEYIRKPCVHQAFYQDAKTIIRHWNFDEYMCADPRTESATIACCKTNPESYYYDDLYWGEKSKLSTALDACDEQLCEEWPRPPCDVAGFTEHTKCWDPNHFWTSEPCTLKVKINPDGTVGIVHGPVYGDDMVEGIVSPETKTFFRVDWEGDYSDIIDNCDGMDTCTMSEDDMCVCDVTVTDAAVFSAQDAPSDDEILEQLHIGGFEATVTDEPISMDTVFEVVDENGVTQLRKNVETRVTVVGTSLSFRSPPHFVSLSDEEARDMHFETDAVLDHYFYHANTAPFLAIRFAQRFGISNPSPQYVESIATAFRSGSYSYSADGGSASVEFGSGVYGDLGATVAAVLLEPESRDVILDEDPAHGALKEPLMKVTGILRSMEYEQRDNKSFLQFEELFGGRIGQMAHELPNVFSFFRPEFQPSGRVAQGNLVSPEAQVTTAPRQVSTMNGLYSLIQFGLTQCYSGFGPYVGWCTPNLDWYDLSQDSLGLLGYAPAPSQDIDATIEDLATLLTAGRLSNEKRQYIKEIMESEDDPALAIQKAQQLIVSTPEFHATGLVKATGEEREAPEAVQSSDEAYKAVVYVLLDGGVDSYNMLAPHKCSQQNQDGLNLLEQYNLERTTIALSDAERFRIIQAQNQPCDEFAIHPDLPIVEQLYKDGELAFFANMGVLDTPVTKDNYYSLTRTDLFAHNTMQNEAQRIDPWDTTPGTGILGRVCDVLSQNGFNPQPITIEDSSVATVGVPGASVPPLIMSAEGTEEFNPKPENDVFDVSQHIAQMNQHTDMHSSVFAETWSHGLQKAIFDAENFIQAIEDVELTQDFDAINSFQYGDKFKTLSNIIMSNEARGNDRDVFFMRVGFWDHHDSLRDQLSNEFMGLNAGLDTFQREMKAQNMWDKVTLVITSDFARTLTANSGEGSDHAWGGNYFAMGGDVKGGKIFGEYPHDITASGPYNIGRGRLIPNLSYESMLNGIVQWMGVDTEEDLMYCMPNRFRAGAELFTKDDIFHNAADARKLRGGNSGHNKKQQ